MIALVIGVMWGVAWFAYAVGRANAARAYASSLATARSRCRRLQADLDKAYAETAMVRRNGRGGAA